MSHITKSLQTPNKRFTSFELLKTPPLTADCKTANPRQIGEIFDLQRLDNPSSRLSNLRHSGQAKRSCCKFQASLLSDIANFIPRGTNL